MLLSACNPVQVEVELSSYTVTYETMGGTPVASETYTENDHIFPQSTPTKQGYRFAGWYFDQSYTRLVKTTTIVTSDLTVYAKWIPYTITEVNDEELELIKILFDAYGIDDPFLSQVQSMLDQSLISDDAILTLVSQSMHNYELNEVISTEIVLSIVQTILTYDGTLTQDNLIRIISSQIDVISLFNHYVEMMLLRIQDASALIIVKNGIEIVSNYIGLVYASSETGYYVLTNIEALPEFETYTLSMNLYTSGQSVSIPSSQMNIAYQSQKHGIAVIHVVTTLSIEPVTLQLSSPLESYHLVYQVSHPTYRFSSENFFTVEDVNLLYEHASYGSTNAFSFYDPNQHLYSGGILVNVYGEVVGLRLNPTDENTNTIKYALMVETLVGIIPKFSH